MFQRRPRRFKRHSNGRNHMSRGNGGAQVRLRTNSFVNDQTRNKFRTHQSAEKLLEKYNNLAKEAMSSGDKTLSENYLQHADHFMRIIEDKNKNRNHTRDSIPDKPSNENKTLSDDNTIDQKEEIKNKT